ncbi:MAG: sensor histidine kinase [Caloramator sp.]|nr:sensor histidine kinase [Caloramator sp.]
MNKPKVDISEVNNIIKKVIQNIVSSKETIVNIVDGIRKDQERIVFEIAALKNEIISVINEVDELERKDKLMRQKLAEVSKYFDKYTEKDIKEIYDRAYETRRLLDSKRYEEKRLRDRRDSLELQIKKLDENIKNGEKIISQISVALKYLEGDILPAFKIDGKESEMLLGIKILEAQEYERQRIARDIHDGPAQYVSSAVIRLDFAKKIIQKDLDEGIKELEELKRILQTSVKEIRGIIHDLRPMSLDDLGLMHTIQEHVKSLIEQKNINISLKLKPIKDEVEPIIQVAVYRILQELLNNIIKHSKAKNVDVKLDFGLKYLMLIVCDDGVGFDVEETLKIVKYKGSNYGLLGIMERVNQLQGDFQVESKKGIGTTFKIKLPVNREVFKDDKED